MYAKPKGNITTDEILRLIFKYNIKQIKSDYQSVGWFNEMIDKMKGEFIVGTVNKNGNLSYVIIGDKLTVEIEADEFHDYYEVSSEK